jgi:hypothetical protein
VPAGLFLEIDAAMADVTIAEPTSVKAPAKSDGVSADQTIDEIARGGPGMSDDV